MFVYIIPIICLAPNPCFPPVGGPRGGKGGVSKSPVLGDLGGNANEIADV